MATIGPACWDEPMLRALLVSGVSVARFNFSHAEHQQTAAKISLIRRIAEEERLNVAVLADLQGPRVRIGDLPPDGILLLPGEIITLDTFNPDYLPGNIPVDYERLAVDVMPGDLLLLDEGLLSLRVAETQPESGKITCVVVVGGLLTSNKGINVPGRSLGVPTITEKDRHDLQFALAQGVNMVALSFVRAGSDIAEGRKLVTSFTDRRISIIAKIEKSAAVEHFSEILAEADGIMLARGDLGVEMPPELLPAIQKRIIAACNLAAKPVITATQMLDSMIRNPRPTRAEATDVANAVLDGSDSIMLSGETATGKYPLEAVQSMARIALEAEKLFDYEGWTEQITNQTTREEERQTLESDPQISEIVCQAADRISDRLDAKAIIAITRTGTSARLVSKYRPGSVLIAVTDSEDTCKALALSWGVHILRVDELGDTLATMAEAEKQAIDQEIVAGGDILVFVGGMGQPQAGPNVLKVRIVGE